MTDYINLEKVKKEFEKAEFDEQIEKYNTLGTWIHENIEAKEKELQEQKSKMKNSQTQN